MLDQGIGKPVGLFACGRLGKCQTENSGQLKDAAYCNSRKGICRFIMEEYLARRVGRTYAFRPAAFCINTSVSVPKKL